MGYYVTFKRLYIYNFTHRKGDTIPGMGYSVEKRFVPELMSSGILSMHAFWHFVRIPIMYMYDIGKPWSNYLNCY